MSAPERAKVTCSAFWIAKVFGANSPTTTCKNVTSEKAITNESIVETEDSIPKISTVFDQPNASKIGCKIILYIYN